MNAEEPKSARDVLRALIREVDEEESDAIWAGVERDLVVDYTSGHWLPGPLSREQLGAIRLWLSGAKAQSGAMTEFRKSTWAAQKGSGTDSGLGDSLETSGAMTEFRKSTWVAQKGSGADSVSGDSLETWLKPPVAGLEEPRFHWLPTLLRNKEDGARSVLILQSRDPAHDVPPPFPMVVLDGDVMDLVDDGWEYKEAQGLLRFELEGSVPEQYTLDITRSDDGSIVLRINSVSDRD